MTKTQKRIPFLDYLSNVGERVQWLNIKQEVLEGTLIFMDENCLATIRLDDGTEINVQC